MTFNAMTFAKCAEACKENATRSDILDDLYEKLINLQLQLGSDYQGENLLMGRIEAAVDDEPFSKMLIHSSPEAPDKMIQSLHKGIAKEQKEQDSENKKINQAVINYTQTALGKGKNYYGGKRRHRDHCHKRDHTDRGHDGKKP